jgi:hypothetical protein
MTVKERNLKRKFQKRRGNEKRGRDVQEESRKIIEERFFIRLYQEKVDGG